MVATAGVIERDATVDEVSVVVPLTVPNTAVIAVEPVVEAAAWARPVLLIDAIPVFEELQIT